ncbi:MAG TPA: glycosyltransferase [Candidatus Saccharimonadales bacterium]|nr:glycosyltransferase [Candidatus Saccharimonadales bacterium]
MVPRVSVVIPTYNRWPMLGEAIESVLGQTYPGFELIVVDDGSTDDTVAQLGKYRSRLRLFSQARKGVSAARNVGAGEARGSLLAFLDSDDLWRPTKLAFQADFMELHPEIAVCQTDEIWIRNGVRVNPRAIHRKPDGDIFLPSLDLCLVSPSAVIMRRDLFMALGGFDEALPVCEDYDLWLRIAIDHQVALIPEPLVIKRGGHADQLSHSVWGMDRFRVIALQKLLRSDISRARREAAVDVLRRKVRILAHGARKRGKEPEALAYEGMLTEFDKESRNVGDSDSRARPSQRFSSANAGTLA